MENTELQLNTTNNSTALVTVTNTNVRNVLTLFPNAHGNTFFSTFTINTPAKQLRSLTAFVANSSLFRANTLVDIAVSDRLSEEGRFVIKYVFTSSLYNNRLSIEVNTNETAAVPSLATAFFANKAIFASAGWLEREAWDLFGVFFAQNSDLRRILTDYGFSGHPLRKDFPLTGFSELVYNDSEGRVTIEPIELAQEFRIFHI